MKTYVQFYTRDLSNNLFEALASDSVFNLDRRYKLENHIQQAFNRAERLKQVKPHYEAFKIMQGIRCSSSKALTDIIMLKSELQ